jgi:predicted anti-sigma-YlaC factor YlaD
MDTDDHNAARRRRITRLRHRGWTLLAVTLRRRPLVCQEMVELVTAYLENTLDPVTLARFEAHLRQCDGCATYLAELRVTVATMGRIRDEQLDPVFRTRLLNAFTETAQS